jgi:hypothetical protein
MEAARTSETLVNFYQTTRRNNQKTVIFIIAAVRNSNPTLYSMYVYVSGIVQKEVSHELFSLKAEEKRYMSHTSMFMGYIRICFTCQPPPPPQFSTLEKQEHLGLIISIKRPVLPMNVNYSLDP